MVNFANDLPTIGITMGDAAGIGPEIVLRSLAGSHSAEFNSLIIGDGEHLRSVASQFGVDEVLDRENVAVDDLANLSREFVLGTDACGHLLRHHPIFPTMLHFLCLIYATLVIYTISERAAILSKS